jgi:hypothetical protein
MANYCQNCGKEIPDYCSVCPNCSYVIIKEPRIVDVSKVTTISGQTYSISGSIVSSPSFYSIADKFEDRDKVGKPKEYLKRDELKSDTVNDKKLDLYVGWGYLKENPDESLSLTEYGKQAYEKNRIKKKKLEEESK